MQKLEFVEETQEYEAWDVKKILAFLIIAVIIGLSLKTFVLDKKSSSPTNSENVQGANTKEIPSPTPISTESLTKNVQTTLDNLKKEVNNINVVEVATSTPAVQKVINDLKNLQDLPQNQAKEMCLKICSGL